MKLIFEKSRKGRRCSIMGECDVPERELPEGLRRKKPLRLPEVSETDVSRHFKQLADRSFGVNSGFYPLGSCTMKYNPKINDEIAGLPGFTDIHPLAPVSAVQGCLEALACAEKLLAEISGMDRVTFQPAAGAHGEFTGVLLIKAYHESRGDFKRTKVLVPDSAHGTNPATAAMAGFSVVNIPSDPSGGVDLEKLKEAVSEETACIMLTNPNTVGLFDKNIKEITRIVHEAGGLCYYDGANLNAVMGIARPGDMGFDVTHLNLHKTFSTPHGGGGPGSGAVGCKEILAPFLPLYQQKALEDGYAFEFPTQSIGTVKAFYGNFLVVVRALCYMLMLGAEGAREVSELAVLNANYLKGKLSDIYETAYDEFCMHEFILTLSKLKKECGVTALDVSKALLDRGVHPPTMYFPLIVDEALMVEPTETESVETLDEVADIFREIYEKAYSDPESLHNSPLTTPVRRPDEVMAARNPKLTYFADAQR